MEQPILSTKKSPFVAQFATFLGERVGRRARSGKTLRFTEAQGQSLLIGVDLLLLLAGGLAAWRLTQSSGSGFGDITRLDKLMSEWLWVGLFPGAWFLFGWLTDLYDVRLAQGRGQGTARIGLVELLSVLVVVLAASLLGVAYPGVFLLYYVTLSLVLLITWRLAFAALSKTAIFAYKVAILGTGSGARMIAKLLRQEQAAYYAVAGFMSVHPAAEAKTCDGLPVWDTTPSLLDRVRDLQIDTLITAFEDEFNPALFAELMACQAHGISIVSVPAVYHRLCHKVPVAHVRSEWLMEAVHSSSGQARRFCKRTLDLTFSLLALPWFLLIFPLIALAIKLDSPGPILYRQVRSGLGGKPFQILKFRTMYTDAEKDGKARWAQTNDPRITQVGRLLRKSRLDELPQFINILRGEMSLIGPRPERPEFVAQLEQELPYYCARQLVPPGLTGWAQIKYTYGSSVEDALIKLEYDVYYVRHWSLWMDIYILFQTVNVVLRAKGT